MKTIEEYRQEVMNDFGPDIDELVLVDALAVCRQLRDQEKEQWVCTECKRGTVSYKGATLYVCNNCNAEFSGRAF